MKTDEWYSRRALGRFKGKLEVDQKRSVPFKHESHIFGSSWVIDDRYHNDPGVAAYYVDKNDEIAGINFACPGCGQVTTIGFGEPWKWDGNVGSPTCTPSIKHSDMKGGCGWHGVLTAGIFRGV